MTIIKIGQTLKMVGSIAQRWREINGESNWNGLLAPLDIDLRRNIIFYGELVQLVYDAFIREEKSSFAGASRHPKSDLLVRSTTSLGQESMYEVTKYIYATSGIAAGMPRSFMVKSLSREAWSKESNWMGFVAAATDAGKAALGRRDIVVAWRGTLKPLEWINNLDFTLVPAPAIFRGRKSDEPLVHRGWLDVYTSDDPMSPYNKDSARTQLLQELARLAEKYKDEETSITFTGHSLGAALATLSAFDVAANGFNKAAGLFHRHCPVAAFAFASPRVGNSNFLRAFAGTPHLRLLRVRNAPDLVPDYPPLGYSDVGVELRADTRRSPYLKKDDGDLQIWHNMECYLHGISGVQGKGEEFELVVDRDLALINKSTDALKDEYLVPGDWWVEKDKSMAKGSDGRFSLA